jgi:hypothetical protein
VSLSTKTPGESAEKEDCQPFLVAVSEENLAALLRATSSSTEPKGQRPAENAEAVATETAADDGISAPAPPRAASCPEPEPAKSPAVEAVESGVALFAAVKERRSAILRSGVNPVAPPLDLPPAGKVDITEGPVEQCENVSVILPPEVAPLQVTLPTSQPLMPALATSIANPSNMAIAGGQSRDTSRNHLVLSLTIGVVLVMVGISAFLIRAPSSKSPKVAMSAPKNGVPLQVQVEQIGNGLINVRWNPQSTPIAEARNGRLVITGRDQQPQLLSLDAQQLATGQLNYKSSAEWLQFQLEIVDNAGKVSGESVVTLSSRPPLVVTSLTPPQVANSQSPARKVESIPIPSRNADALQPAKTMEVTPNRPLAPRAFTPPPANGSRDGQVPAISFDQPPVIPSNTALPPTLVPSAALNNLPAPVVNRPPTTKQVRVGGSVQAASLIRKVAPHYPPIAMSAHLEETVRFTALIGKDGTVRNLQRISGSQVFLQAAAEAVKQWIYRPTLLNGDPVEVITQIDVNFTLK